MLPPIDLATGLAALGLLENDDVERIFARDKLPALWSRNSNNIDRILEAANDEDTRDVLVFVGLCTTDGNIDANYINEISNDVISDWAMVTTG